ncbi:MAG TPA: hypothetical protein VK525_06715 [Candidatus Saccharimonadales bacterium]|nr:hypothetical protein [Candidatus Saccharimonadales bacterium]
MTTAQMSTKAVKVRQFAKQSQFSVLALALMSVWPSCLPAQEAHSHAPQQQELTPDQRSRAGALLKTVREATERFRDVAVAESEGYALQFGCVSGADSGAMGLHFVNGDLVGKGVLDATRPQIVIYEAQPNGRLRLIGADYLLIKSAWDAKYSSPPELMGQLFHLFDAPNRFGLPAFYTLHVWAWKENPNGAFVNWHPNVSCESFNGKNP